MKKLTLALGLLALMPATSAYAQAVINMAPQSNVLRAGTPITLRVIQGTTTKNKVAKVNDRIRLEVAEPVRVGDIIIIPAGSPAVAELTTVKYKGGWGKGGFLAGRALNVDANGRTIRVSGSFDSKGGKGTVGAVAVSALVFAPAGFFMTGKSAEIPSGMVIPAFIDEDIQFQVSGNAKPANAPMVIGQ
jgi:hypothetical protein